VDTIALLNQAERDPVIQSEPTRGNDEIFGTDVVTVKAVVDELDDITMGDYS